MPVPDPDLAAFASSGSPDAFRRLVERHVDAVYSTASRLLWGWPAEAADVAQSVFILLAQKAPRLNPELVVGSWLHRQTVRHALNARRTETRRAARERTAADLLVMNANASSDPTSTLLPHIDEAILALPERDREMLVLHYFDQHSQREIATRLGLSANAVQKRLSRALERVRRHLARRGVAVTAVALAAWFSGSSVQAAPAALGASIAAQALPHAAVAGSGFLTKIISIMTHTKALAAGTALGLAAGGIQALRPLHATAASAGALAAGAAAGTVPAPPPPALSGGKTPQAALPGVPVPAMTAEGLAGQLADFAAQPNTEATRLRIQAWAAGIDQALLQPLFDLAGKGNSIEGNTINLAGRRMFIHEVNALLNHVGRGRAWADGGGGNAVAALARLAGNKVMSGAALAGAAFDSWLSRDTAAAQQWLVDHQDDQELAQALPKCVSAVAVRLLARSEHAALAWTAQLQDPNLQRAALADCSSVVCSTGPSGRWRQFGQRILNQPDDAFSRLALRTMFDSFFGLGHSGYHFDFRSPVGMIDEWVGQLPAGPRAVAAAEEALACAVDSDDPHPPRAALDQLARAHPGRTEEAARRVILTTEYIAPQSREWLLPLLHGPDREELLLRAARLTAQVAMNEGIGTIRKARQQALLWAAEVADPGVRDPLIYGITRQWLERNSSREDQPPTAQIDAWLATNPLPEDCKVSIDWAVQDFKLQTSPAK